MKVGLIGLGHAGLTLHLPALARLPSVTVVAGCDQDVSQRRRAAAQHRIPVFGDFDEMVREKSPELVVIGTPPHTHTEYCLRAIAAGADVICEKPFVQTLDEADRVLGAADRAGRKLAVNHQFREMPIFRVLIDEAGRGGRGALAFVQIWQLMDLPPWKEQGWRGQMVHRTLHEAGVHLVDFVMALFGEKPVSVQATTSAAGREEERTDPIVVAVLEFSKGRLAQITQNRVCKGPMQYFEVRAELPNASLRASFGGRSRVSAGLHRSTRPHLRFDVGRSGLAWIEAGPRRVTLARNPKDPMVLATADVFARTMEAFRRGTEPPTSGRRAREVLDVIAACYHSASVGHRVALVSS